MNAPCSHVGGLAVACAVSGVIPDKYPSIGIVPKSALTEEDRARGRELGALLQRARRTEGLTASAVSGRSDVPLDTVRAIEAGRVANPGFFTVAALARAVRLDLDDLAQQ